MGVQELCIGTTDAGTYEDECRGSVAGFVHDLPGLEIILTLLDLQSCLVVEV